MNIQEEIKRVTDEIRDLLIMKNEKYGNSALNPIRVFSKANAIEQLLIRIDDKLSRIKNAGLGDDMEDTVKDLIGYLILLKIAMDD